MPVLEIAVQDAAGARIARSEGAERVELCSALSTGGLTPSVGILRTTIEVGLPVHVLIRPRPGGYVYDATEVEAMVADIVCSMELGAQGVVIGALDGAESALDLPVLGQLATAARSVNPDVEITVHRCVDVLLERGIEPQRIIRGLVELGATRVLTSGGATRSTDGVDTLTQLHQLAEGRVQIQAGGGVRIGDIPRLRHLDGVHLSARHSVNGGAAGPGGGSGHIDATSAELVHQARVALDAS